MSASFSAKLCAVVPPDEEYLKLREVVLACKKADIDVPDEVYEYFEKLGIEVYEVDDIPTDTKEILLGYNSDYDIESGEVPFKEFLLEEIPKGTISLRLYANISC